MTLDDVAVVFFFIDWLPVYTCPSTENIYLPAVDTYPHHCGKYQECVDGRGVDRKCADGAHYVYGRTREACRHPHDPETFCNKMKTFFNVTE